MITLEIVFLILWIAFSVISYGFIYSTMKNQYPEFAHLDEPDDFKLALILSLGGPITLVITLLRGYGDYGTKFKRNRVKP